MFFKRSQFFRRSYLGRVSPGFALIFLCFALAFLPLSSGLVLREKQADLSLGMSAPTPILTDAAKTRASVAGVDRLILYLPSLYTNYAPYSYGLSQHLSFLPFEASLRDLSQWQQWRL
ncbi:MAG: hypothetical protein ACRCYY_02130 [Trueperaceae bacterium]